MPKYCTDCGVHSEESNKFCTKCGNSVSMMTKNKNKKEKKNFVWILYTVMAGLFILLALAIPWLWIVYAIIFVGFLINVFSK